jgi:hypothetical protein
MSNDDIDDVFLRNCCYPGCSQDMLCCPRTCGYQYPLCKVHLGKKLYLMDKLLSSQTSNMGMPSAFNIWYKNRFIANDNPYHFIEEIYISLYDNGDILARIIRRSWDYLDNLMMIYTKDNHPSWYDNGVTDEGCYRILTPEEMEEHTYKYKLYDMRTDELYFGAIPRDILDEIIKYL